jgi:putative oxidoreductase
MGEIRRLLEGLHEWQWVGILLARLAVGLLFFLSGRGKLFLPARREAMRQTLREAGVPWPRFNALFVAGVEFVCGGLLVCGALTPLACLLLIGVMVVALATSRIRSIRAASPLDWLGEFLYLPEVLYLVILVWLLLSGPGWPSVDALILSRAGAASLP